MYSCAQTREFLDPCNVNSAWNESVSDHLVQTLGTQSWTLASANVRNRRKETKEEAGSDDEELSLEQGVNLSVEQDPVQAFKDSLANRRIECSRDAFPGI